MRDGNGALRECADNSEMVIYTTADGLTKIETTFDGDTVWLSIDQMAELLKEVHSIKFAISWSGACHDGIGVFKGWFDEYYQEALENGYAKIPMFWRENLLLSKKWFDDIRDTTPMMGLIMYAGPILAIAGDKDELVP